MLIDTDAVVFHLHIIHATCLARFDPYRLVGRGVFYGVIEDIDERLGYGFAISVNGRQVFGKLHRRCKPFMLQMRSVRLHNSGHDLVECHRFKMILLLSRFHPGKVQNIIDEACQPFSLLENGFIIFLFLFFCLHAFHGERFCEHTDKRKWCPQLV